MSQSPRIATNLRTLLVMEALGHSDKPMTATEINQHIGLPKQTIHRLVATLVDEGFLVREDGGKKFRPSRRSRMMGAGLLYASRHSQARHQILKWVSDQVKETVNFVVPEDSGMHYLDRVDADWPFRIQLPIGTNVPFHCTASGKTFMASLPPKARQNFVASLDLENLTKTTLSKPADLLDDLKLTRKRGYAVDNEEFMEGMIAIAVPVMDDNQRYVASLAFHGPTQRLTVAKAVEQRHILVEGAQKLRAALFS